MNKLLAKLQKKKIQLPETDFYVPELGETLTLRGMTVREGREWRKLLPQEGQDIGTQERGTLAAAAYCVVDPETGERYLNNDDGRALLEGLSERTILNLINAYNDMTREKAESAEGNSGARVVIAGSSSDSPSPSAEPSTSSSEPSARLN